MYKLCEVFSCLGFSCNPVKKLNHGVGINLGIWILNVQVICSSIPYQCESLNVLIIKDFSVANINSTYNCINMKVWFLCVLANYYRINYASLCNRHKKYSIYSYNN